MTGGDQRQLADAIKNHDSWWWNTARHALEHLAAQGRPFETFDLTEHGTPDPDHPGRWGALFAVAARDGVIECVGYSVSRRPSRSHGLTRLWRGCRTNR